MMRRVNHAEKQRLKADFVVLAAYYQQTLHDSALAMYAEDLSDMDYGDVADAMRRLRCQPGRRSCPLPADIRDEAAPSQGSIVAQANDIAGRISAAISRYGYTRAEEAKQYIGDTGWLVVGRMGGWRQICTTLLSSEMGTFRAQCRDMARSALEIGTRPSPPALPAPSRLAIGSGSLTSAKQVVAAVLNDASLSAHGG